MRLLYFLVIFSSCFQPIKESHSMGPAFKTIYNIGDCLAYHHEDSRYSGLFLYNITKEEDSIYYDFLLSPTTFGTKPDIQAFTQAGFWGSRIPTSTRETVLGTYLHSIEESALLKEKSRCEVIGRIPISREENRPGRSGGYRTFSTIITQQDEYIKDAAKQNRTILDGPAATIISYDELKKGYGSDLKQPEEIWILSRKSAHPNAVNLMSEEWMWSPVDEFAPFGNDAGSDALHTFREWRLSNASDEPADFLKFLEERWGASFGRQVNLTGYEEIRNEYRTNIQYTDMDQSIIALAFAQLVLEGNISKQAKKFALQAIQRQTLLTENNDYKFSTGGRHRYLEVLKKLSDILNKVQ